MLLNHEAKWKITDTLRSVEEYYYSNLVTRNSGITILCKPEYVGDVMLVLCSVYGDFYKVYIESTVFKDLYSIRIKNNETQ